MLTARDVVADETASAQRNNDEFRVGGIAVDNENFGRGYALHLLTLLQVLLQVVLQVVPSAQSRHTEISAWQNLFAFDARFGFRFLVTID
jgi:hypothetical protein